MSSFPKTLGLSKASVFGKIAILIAVVSIVLSVTIAWMGAQITRGLAKENLEDLAAKSSTDLASRLSRAIRFKDAAAIESQLQDFWTLAEDRLEAAVVLTDDGQVMHSIGSVSQGRPSLVEFSSRVTETSHLAIDARRFMKAVPVLLGDSENQVGVLGILWSAEEVLADVARKELVIKLTALALFVAMLGLSALFVRRFVTGPLVRLGGALSLTASGDYGATVDGLDRQDELGVFARDLCDLQRRLNESRQLQLAREKEQLEQQRVVAALREGLNALSQRDLSREISMPFSEEYEPLRQDFNNGVRELREILSAVIDNISSVRGGAEEISASSDNLAHRTETQAATLEQTASTLTQITESVSDAAGNARAVEKIVLEAQRQTDESDSVVKDAVGAMSEIEKSSEQISNIIAVIDDIAFQTNLLALNAGVEAARAGEAGRGFAVVATEVRSLAQRSADAAKEIKSLITGSAQQVEQGVCLVRKAGDALSSISDQVSHISGLMTGIASSTSEQASGISEINSGVSHLEMVTQENAAMVEESNAAGHLLRQQAIELTDLIRQFKVDQPMREGIEYTNINSQSAA